MACFQFQFKPKSQSSGKLLLASRMLYKPAVLLTTLWMTACNSQFYGGHGGDFGDGFYAGGGPYGHGPYGSGHYGPYGHNGYGPYGPYGNGPIGGGFNPGG